MCAHMHMFVPLLSTDYRSAFVVGRPPIEVVTPRNIAHDHLRNLIIKTLIDYL